MNCFVTNPFTLRSQFHRNKAMMAPTTPRSSQFAIYIAIVAAACDDVAADACAVADGAAVSEEPGSKLK